MKQIFYWLREQTEINKKDAEQRYERQLEILSTIAPHYGGKISAYCEMLGLVSQAEAKWESDCCEWKQYLKPYGIRYQNCRATESPVDIFAFKFCLYCGKPIKISEVE